jgi:predicted TIM-barrel fold metal-dependent hydrolase
MVTVKSTAAYQRDLHFREVSAADAAAEFDSMMRDAEPVPEGYRLTENRPYRRLADHMFHHLVSLADAHGVPFQIHTGLHAGNGNFLTNSRPTDLTNIFLKFPRVTFDLFHIGYPYWRECAVLAKTFPNVNIDFCWMHIVSPSGARAALHEMLDSVPASKIMGYGGDYRYPELSYGHLVIARRNIARVLAERVEAGANTEGEAAQIGQWLLAGNPARVFARK